jgi:queuine tRNA-ribosyltransferase
MQFTILNKDKHSRARACTIQTGHGAIETPIFMPVATTGAIKAVDQTYLEMQVKAQIILGNTYHLYLRPGTDIIHAAGGLNKFISWHKPMLTDSGGYQVFSLAEKRKVREEGVTFQSHIDGSKHLITPEKAIDIQRLLGADIMMVLDECTPYPCDHKTAKKSMELTHQWLKRGCKRFDETEPAYGHEQFIFPIVQGSTHKDLRKISAETIAELGRDGNAIGGLSVGEPTNEMYEMTDIVTSILPEDKPRYLMGVGTPANLLESIALGIDMFDCVIPTRNGRNGWLFTQNGIINIKNKKWENDFSSIEEHTDLPANTQYSKAYLRHLIQSHEMVGAQIASLHNLHLYLWLMQEARKHILNNTFSNWKAKMVIQLMQRL